MVLCHFRRTLSLSTTYDRLLLLVSVPNKMATKCISSRPDCEEKLKKMAICKPVTHCIFDMDGLLLDTETLYKDIYQIICKEFGKEYDVELLFASQGFLRQERAKYIIEKLNLPLNVEEFTSKLKLLYLEIFPKSKLMPGSKAWLLMNIHHHVSLLYFMIWLKVYLNFISQKWSADTEVVYKKILSEMTDSYGKEYTREAQLKVLGTTEQTTARIIIEEYGLPLTPAEFLVEFQKKQKIELANSTLMEGAERLIRHLHKHKVPIAVATSSSFDSVLVKTENHTELFRLFHHIVMGSSDPEVKNGKPAPDIFKICAERFEDRPAYDKCLVFEDAPNGVTGAVAAGMQSVMVPDPLLPKERTTHATMVLKSLMDFEPEVFGLPAF